MILLGSAHVAINGAFDNDKSRQVAAAESLLAGRGLTYRVASAEKPPEVSDKPLGGWPPLYSLAFAALLPVCGDLWLTSLALDILAYAVFAVSWFLALEMLAPAVSRGARLLFWVYWALVFNPLMLNGLGSAERLAMALFAAAVAMCLASFGSRRRVVWAVGSGLCAGLAAAARYPFWPLILVPALGMAAAAWKDEQKRKTLIAAAACGAASIAVLAAVAVFLKATTGVVLGNEDYVASGLHWNHLSQMCAFPAWAANIPDLWRFARHEVHLLNTVPINLVSATASAVMLVLVVAPLFGMRRQLAPSAESPVAPARLTAFVVMGVLTTLLTVAMLCYLSLRVESLTYEDSYLFKMSGWTPVEEKRYYVPLSPFFLIAAASSVAYLFRRAVTTRVGRLTKVGLAVVVVGWMLLGMAAAAKPLAVWAVDYRETRTKTAASRTYARQVQEIVEGHVAQGYTVLLAIEPGFGNLEMAARTQWSVQMAGGCPASLDALRDLPTRSAQTTVVLVALVDEDPDHVLDKSRQYVAGHPAFREAASANGLQLYEAVFPDQ